MLRRILVALVLLATPTAAQQIGPGQGSVFSGPGIPQSTLGQPNGPAPLDSLGNASALKTIATAAITARTNADRAAEFMDVADYGAVCNGVIGNATADTTAINAANAARAAAGGGDTRVKFGAICEANAPIVIPAAVHFRGQGKEASHLYSAIANPSPLVQLTGAGSEISDLDLDPNAFSVPTSGTALSFNAGISDASARDLNISQPCNGLDLNGSVVRVQRVYMILVHGTGCSGLRVGNLTTGGNTVNAEIDGVTISADVTNPPDAGMLFLDAGGALLHHSSVSGAGTVIRPGASQVVEWLTGSDTYLGDLTTTGVVAFKVDTGAASAIVKGINCVNCWASSAAAAFNVQVTNSGGGIVAGVHLVGLRSYNGGGSAIVVQGGTNFSLDSSFVCGTSNGNADISVATSVSSVAIRNNILGGACDGFGTTPAQGIVLGGNNTDVVITGNDFAGVTVPVSGTPIGDSVVATNTLLDTQAATIASASSIALTNSYSAYVVTGNTGISTMTGVWNRRQVTLFAASSIVFSTGGNICAAFTSAANVPILAQYVGSCWYLK